MNANSFCCRGLIPIGSQLEIATLLSGGALAAGIATKSRQLAPCRSLVKKPAISSVLGYMLRCPIK